jgi:hypothetical protein
VESSSAFDVPFDRGSNRIFAEVNFATINFATKEGMFHSQSRIDAKVHSTGLSRELDLALAD